MSEQIVEKRPKLLCSVRFSFSILCFLLNVTHYMHRNSINLAIICMVTSKKCLMSNEDPTDEIATSSNQTSTQDCSVNSELNWSKPLQGIILSSVYVGYLLSQIVGSWIALKIGAKLLILLTTLASSILTILTPLSANYHYISLIILRLCLGLVQGCVSSTQTLFWSTWAPPLERSTLLSIANSGSLIGNTIIFLIGGMLCVGSFLGGWPSIFYLTGSVGLIWCVVWQLFASNSPEDHKFISVEERNYVLEKTFQDKPAGKQSIPWRCLLRSKPVYCLIVTTLCANFGISLFTTSLPTYMNEVLHFDIKSNGELSSIPFITCWLAIIVTGVISDKLIRGGILSKCATRKLFNSIGFLFPGLTFVGLMFVSSSSRVIGFILILTNITLSGCQYGGGYLVNFNDIGGKYSGVVYGIAHTIGGAAAVILPSLIGILTPNQEWMLIFIILAVIYLIGFVVFNMFSDANTQSWAVNEREEEERAVEQKEELKDLS